MIYLLAYLRGKGTLKRLISHVKYKKPISLLWRLFLGKEIRPYYQ